MKISVLIALYNSEKFIKQTLESLLRQTYQDFEIILVDDYSSDNTMQVVLKTLNGKIPFTLKSNYHQKGLSNALNIALESAKGEYVALIDHDDIALKTRFEEQVAILERNSNIGVCGSWMQEFEKGQNTWKYPEIHENLKVLVLTQSPIANPTAMFRRSVASKDNIKYEDKYDFAQDYAFWLDLISITEFYIIPKVLVEYRVHSNNASSIKHQQQFNSWKNALKNKLLEPVNCVISESDYKILYDMKYPNFTVKYLDKKEEVVNLVNRISSMNSEKKLFEPSSLSVFFEFKLKNFK